LQHKVVKLIGQVDVTGWHGAALFATSPVFRVFAPFRPFIILSSVGGQAQFLLGSRHQNMHAHRNDA
jgi:hypothetical protein